MKGFRLIALLVTPLLSAAIAAELPARPHFFTPRQQPVGTAISLFQPPQTPFRGRILLIPGRSDAVRSDNPLTALQTPFAELGYASWVLLREPNDNDHLLPTVQQLITHAQAYVPPKTAARAQALAAQTRVLLVLHGDAATFFNALSAHENVEAMVLLGGESISGDSLNKPVLDIFSAPDHSSAYQAFLQRKQQWQGPYYRALDNDGARDQRFLFNEQWLGRRIIGWWRQHAH